MNVQPHRGSAPHASSPVTQGREPVSKAPTPRTRAHALPIDVCNLIFEYLGPRCSQMTLLNKTLRDHERSSPRLFQAFRHFEEEVRQQHYRNMADRSWTPAEVMPMSENAITPPGSPQWISDGEVKDGWDSENGGTSSDSEGIPDNMLEGSDDESLLDQSTQIDPLFLRLLSETPDESRRATCLFLKKVATILKDPVQERWCRMLSQQARNDLVTAVLGIAPEIPVRETAIVTLVERMDVHLPPSSLVPLIHHGRHGLLYWMLANKRTIIDPNQLPPHVAPHVRQVGAILLFNAIKLFDPTALEILLDHGADPDTVILAGNSGSPPITPRSLFPDYFPQRMSLFGRSHLNG